MALSVKLDQQVKQLKIVVGSQNPVKINAAKVAIEQFFPLAEIQCQGVQCPSGVRDQPMTEEETRLGAENRLKWCQDHYQADFYVTMEGGVDSFPSGPATFAYVAIAYNDLTSIGKSAMLPLPSSVYRALEEGEELGHVMDRVFNTENIKQKGGAIALLTQNKASRESSYTQALTLAMAPILNSEIY